ncbi:hypothetical protein GCM10028799_18060 [Kribbella italica]
MCGASSEAECRGIDEPRRSRMLPISPDFVQAEISYRQQLLRQEYQRPSLFRRLRRTPVAPVPRAQVVRARHAM